MGLRASSRLTCLRPRSYFPTR